MSYDGWRPADDELCRATPQQLETFRRLELRYNLGQGEERWLNRPFDLGAGGILTMQTFVWEPDGHPKEIYRPINPDGSPGEEWSYHYRMV